MNTPEDAVQVEQRSSIKISTNAKMEVQVEVKLYDGADEAEITRLRTLAIDAYKQTRSAVA